MKILVIQLARLGDIYQSWPALRALRRQNPGAEIHVAVRQRYAVALDGLEAVDKLHVLETGRLFSAYVDSSQSAEANAETGLSEQDDSVLAELGTYVEALEAENFDWIINMSFSPTSADLTFILASSTKNSAEREVKVTGYSRHTDGHLDLPDAMSAYFFAQVGYRRPNRFHLCEIFGTMCEADLDPADWHASAQNIRDEDREKLASLPAKYIAVHIGGSEEHKRISVSKWISILKHLRGIQPFKFVVIGSADERDRGESLKAVAPDGEVINLAGDVQLQTCFEIIRGAQILIGPDSAPIHMASLVGIPCLNLSLGRVNHWETGPRAPFSVIMKADDETELMSDRIGDYIVNMIHGQRYPLGTIEVAPGTPSYTGSTTSESEFEWKFCLAVYQGADFPPPIDSLFSEGVKQLRDVNLFMIEQMEGVKSSKDLQARSELLQRGEEIIETVAKLVPTLTPLVRWYQTEKVRIGPAALADVLNKNMETQKLLQGVLDLYSPPLDDAGQFTEADAL